MIFSIDNEVDNYLYDQLYQTNVVELHLDHDYSDSEVDDMVMWINNQGQRQISPLNTTEEYPNYEHYGGTLVLTPPDRVKATFKATTQLESKCLHIPLKRHFKSRFSHMNHPRLTDE